ncbi:HET-domain-containing protein [Nemania sp. FL0031]|nr:HET-domain-containing protein [Nemania sp. FL0031]
MANLTHHGDSLLGERIRAVAGGVVSASLTLFFDWILPSWAKTSYVVFDHIFRARRSDNSPVTSKVSWKFRLVMFSPWLAMCMAYLLWAPNRRIIMIYHGVTGSGINLLFWSGITLQNDGPRDATNKVQLAALDSFVSFAISSYCMTHRSLVWRFFKWTFIRIVVPLLCIGGGLYYFRDLLPVARTCYRIRDSLLIFINNAWDAFDSAEAQVVDQLPRYLQHKWSSYQQRLPERASLPTYQYRPLNPGEIRLLVLKRSPFYPSVIQAGIVHLPIYPPPDYEAVSYRWGSSDLTEEILVDGCRFPVTKAAFDLLLARRTVWRERTLWIDALCINQNDVHEKSEQVQLMRDIYHRASRVIAYPGSDWRYRIAGSFIYELWSLAHQYHTEDIDWQATPDLAKSPQWRSIANLFNDEYFTRSWVIQEIAAGQKIELYLGGAYIPWMIFAEVADWCFHTSRRYLLNGSDEKEMRVWGSGKNIENIAVMTSLRPEAEQWTGAVGAYNHLINLENLFYITSTFRAGDPRDRVFALVGIARSDGDTSLTAPDYNLPVEQVYQNAMRAILSPPKQRLTIHNLALAGAGFSRRSITIPSWVRDFSEQRKCFPYSDVFKEDTCFKASGNLSQDLGIEDATNSLIVKAITIDTIMDLTEVEVLDWGVQDLELTDLFQTLRKLHKFVHSAIDLCRKYPSSSGAADELDYERLWLAFIAGRIERRPASVEFKKVFRYWLQRLDLIALARDRSHFNEIIEESALADLAGTIPYQADTTYQLAVLESCFGRRIGITTSGRLCVVPPLTKVGDSVIIPFGSQTPFLIRQRDNESENVHYELVGEAWVEGVMHGEMIGSADEEFIRLS